MKLNFVDKLNMRRKPHAQAHESVTKHGTR